MILNCNDIVRIFINDNPSINFLNWREHLNHPCDLTSRYGTARCLFVLATWAGWSNPKLIGHYSSKCTIIQLLDKNLHELIQWFFQFFCGLLNIRNGEMVQDFSINSISLNICQVWILPIFRSDITLILHLEPHRYRLHDTPHGGTLFICFLLCRRSPQLVMGHEFGLIDVSQPYFDCQMHIVPCNMWDV